ncbi:Cleavage and polyadenylation specificity factor subunit 3, partial [Dissostichus eleginoides]
MQLGVVPDEYWQNHPELHDIPIYYASSLARKCMAVYQTYINAMNDKIRKAININNPFVFKHISNLKVGGGGPAGGGGGHSRGDKWCSMDHFDDIGPSVVMASPGMMQSGLSRELFESWCTDKRNGVIIAGYCVEGTLAKILVHGEQNEMARLKAALIREYEDNDEVDIEVHNPRNTEAVTLNFRGEKLAKVMGSLTDRKCVQGQRVSGILVKRNFNYHIVTPADLSNYTDLCMSTVTQTQAIPYSGPISLLVSQLRCLAGDVEQLEAERVTVRVFKSITLVHEAGMVLLEVRIHLKSFGGKHNTHGGKKEAFDMDLFVERLELMLHDMFGDDCVNFREGKDLSVTVDGVTATIDPETRRSREVVETTFTPGASRITTIGRGTRTKRTEGGRQWKVCEGFQFILRNQADALLSLGVTPLFKDAVLCPFWRIFLQKSRQAYVHDPVPSSSFRVGDSEASASETETIASSAASLAGSCSDVSQCSGSLDAASFLSARLRRSGSAVMSMRKTLALIHLALTWSREALTLSDLLRLVNEGHVPYVNAYQDLPEEMKLEGKDALIFRVQSVPTHRAVHKQAQALALFLKLPAFPPISRQSLLHPALLSVRYLTEANLP